MAEPMNQSPTSPLKRRRALRKRSTKAETLLWYALRNRKFHGLKFRRQHSIGPYIVDFVSIEKQLVIELDGDYHEYVEAKDKRRQHYIESKVYTVVRFVNDDVFEDVEAVLFAIAQELGFSRP